MSSVLESGQASTIRLALPQTTGVSLVVYDLMGREVTQLVDGHLEQGYHQIVWDGRTASGHYVPAGIYIARLIILAATKSIKIVLLR